MVRALMLTHPTSISEFVTSDFRLFEIHN